MTDTDVRRLGPDDWRAWRDVRLAALADAPEAFGSSLERESAYTDEHWRAWLDPAKGLKAIAGPGGAAGLIGVWTPPDRAAELYSMWVAPQWRGRGVGDRLVAEAVAWAAERRLPHVDLWVVGDNDAAARLYRRHGFRDTGETQPHPRDAGVLERAMRLELTAGQ
ncbi:MAG TPA: GNAT family N-acetyltransferase [Dactylosporangium sp.]|jgi:ribosomal protein S18 acetylase RimI-like enzyme|nr:GNAT family N-acetyltransferase [Dactylosporangium sp.]